MHKEVKDVLKEDMEFFKKNDLVNFKFFVGYRRDYCRLPSQSKEIGSSVTRSYERGIPGSSPYTTYYCSFIDMLKKGSNADSDRCINNLFNHLTANIISDASKTTRWYEMDSTPDKKQ